MTKEIIVADDKEHLKKLIKEELDFQKKLIEKKLVKKELIEKEIEEN